MQKNMESGKDLYQNANKSSLNKRENNTSQGDTNSESTSNTKKDIAHLHVEEIKNVPPLKCML